MRANLWAELPSPIKTAFRTAFHHFAQETYRRTGCILRAYIPAGMGAQMQKEDYLLHMPEEELPDCYISMAFGECSMPAFHKRFLDTGVYEQPKVLCWFPELMVIDLRSLKDNPIPSSFEELADPVYHGELCLIGSQGKPDPLLPLFLYAKQGKSGVKRVLDNVKTVAGPSVTIRHIGRAGNHYGSIFLMPSLFADICRKCPDTMVFCPSTGALAEPILIFWRQDAPRKERTLMAQFLKENECSAIMKATKFPSANHACGDDILIDEWCMEKKLYPERYSIHD